MIRFSGKNNGNSYSLMIETNHTDLFFMILDFLYNAKRKEEESKKKANIPEKTA